MTWVYQQTEPGLVEDGLVAWYHSRCREGFKKQEREEAEAI